MSGDPSAFTRARYRLGCIEQIPLGEGRQFRLDDRKIAVFRTRSGELRAVQATCPHRGGPLADGIVGGDQVVCPLHGLKFDLANGTPIGHDCQPLQTFDVWATAAGDLVADIGP